MRRPSPHAVSLSLALCATALLVAPSAFAADFFVDPATGSDAGDGSAAKPWKTLEDVAKSGALGTKVHAGDTVWLKSGYHGAPVLAGGDFTPPITVAAAAGQKALVAGLTFQGAKGWVVRGLSISPSHAPAPTVGTMVSIDAASARVTLESSELFSVADASGWSATDWVNAASSGIAVKGTDVTVRGNHLTNVRFGISIEGPDALVEKNSVIGFSGDGMRGLGDGDVFQYNVVKDVYVSDADGDPNHDDGFQSWSVGPNGVGTGVVKNVVLRGNVFINREDPNQKFQNAMQGIGCFDGMFDGWIVENNVIATDHWHGISFYGMTNSKIVNNTVIDINDVKPGPPWIMVTAHKDGTPSQNVVVRNNLATDFQLDDGIVNDHNTTLTDLTPFFVDPAKFDLHLLPNAPAVDTGSADQAPAADLEGIPRPQGNGFDLGAYEWHEPGVMPGTGGGGGAGAGGGATGAGGNASGTGTGTGAGTAASGSGGGGGVSGDSASAGEDGGCGCTVEGDAAPNGAWALVALGIALAWRKEERN